MQDFHLTIYCVSLAKPLIPVYWLVFIVMLSRFKIIWRHTFCCVCDVCEGISREV